MATGSQSHGRRVLRAGGPPAAITSGLGVGATGALGDGIETKVTPVANGLAQTVGLPPEFGPPLLIALGLLVLVVAFFIPGLFEDHPRP
jgi:hypothetical protein